MAWPRKSENARLMYHVPWPEHVFPLSPTGHVFFSSQRSPENPSVPVLVFELIRVTHYARTPTYTRTSESRHHIFLRFGIRRNRASSNNHSNRNPDDKNTPHLNIFHWAESNRDEHCTSCSHIPDRSDRHRIYTCVPRRSSTPCTRNRCNHRHKRAPNSPNLQIQLDIDKILSTYRKFHFHYILHHML